MRIISILALLLSSLTANALTVALTWNDPSCTLANPCTAQVYRAQGTCPTDGTIGNLPYTQLSAGGTTPTATGQYPDTTAQPGIAYCYYVTATYVSGGAASGPSNTFQLPALLSPQGLTGEIQ